MSWIVENLQSIRGGQAAPSKENHQLEKVDHVPPKDGTKMETEEIV
jgi:hypothetical protein